MTLVEDLDAFLSDFAVTATVGAVSLSGIFDRAYAEAFGVGGIESTDPAFLLKSSDVTANGIGRGTAITVGGVAYTVRSARPDGTGITVLQLEVA